MSKQPIRVLILAGGQGTRIRHLLPDRPKPMALVQERPLLYWLIRYWSKQGLTSFLISTGYRAEVIQDYFAEHPLPGVTVDCLAEPEALGTGGAIAYCWQKEPVKSDHWLVLNGDSLFFVPWEALLEASTAETQGVIAGRLVEDTERYGSLEVSSDGRLLGFAEKKRGQGPINGGVYLLRNDLLDSIPLGRAVSLEKEIFPDWLRAGRTLKVCRSNWPFIDIGTPETLGAAEKFLAEHQNYLS